MYENPAVFSSECLPPSRRAGQFLMPRIDFDDEQSVKRARRLVQDFGVCGFIIFNGYVEQVREETRILNSLSDIPLFFGCDVERGVGQRISGATRFPFAMAQGAANEESLAKRQAVATAKEMKYCGCNLAFTPVLDVNSEPRNSIINVRAFSDDPSLVSKLGMIFIETLQKGGIMACGKHFPGHGSAVEDSHACLASVEKSEKQLMEFDLKPFREAIAARLHCIMPAHISFPALDPSGLPATLSKVILNDFLRGKLAFNGLIISDSFKMDAIGDSGSEDSNILSALSRGVDIVLDPRDPEGFLERQGELEFFSEPSRTESLGRIFYAKKLFTSVEKKVPLPDFKLNEETSREICRRSACVLRGDILRGEKIFLFHFEAEKSKEHFRGLSEGLSKQGITIEKRFSYPETPAFQYDCSLICVLSASPLAWTDNCFIPEEVADYLKTFSSFSGEKILIVFGSPYAIAEFPFFQTAISFFDSTYTAGIAAAEILTGKQKTLAKLPVKLSEHSSEN